MIAKEFNNAIFREIILLAALFDIMNSPKKERDQYHSALILRDEAEINHNLVNSKDEEEPSVF